MERVDGLDVPARLQGSATAGERLRDIQAVGLLVGMMLLLIALVLFFEVAPGLLT